MEYTKHLLTIPQQVDILEQRGLIIDDRGVAENTLDSISYFRLAGYWRLMESDKVLHTFKPNSHFSQIISLYNFDEELLQKPSKLHISAYKKNSVVLKMNLS